jgi:opacity protein-like surface antigen
MKKLIFILLSIALVSESFAQEFKLLGGNTFSQYTFAPETYYGFDWESGLEFKRTSSLKKGFLIGGGIEFFFTRNIGVEIDLLYFQKGSNSEVLRQGIPYIKTDYNLEVFSVPFLLKVKLRPDSSPYILGGFEFSLIFAHNSKMSLVELPGQDRYEANLNERTKNFDFAVVLGGGFEIKMQGFSFFIEGRYNLGMRNIISDYYPIESIKTKSEVLLFGFKI